jgi:hypothetical protein
MIRLEIRAPVRMAARLACTGLLMAIAGQAWAVTYNVVDLGTLSQGTTVVVRGPNLAGLAVGGGRPAQNADPANPRQGLVFDRGATIPVTGFTNVLGANDVGVIVGAANTASAVRAFAGTRSGSTLELPPLPGDTGSMAYDVNNAGLAVGYSSGPSGERAVSWNEAGQVTALAGSSAVTSRAYSVNAQGTAVGVAGTSTARRATVWAAGVPARELPPLGGHDASEAASINVPGDVVGYSATPAEARRATQWPAGGGAPVDLGTLPGGTVSQALGINNVGIVVGYSAAGEEARACVWTNGIAEDLNGLATLNGVVLTKAVGINNAGMILVLGHESGDGHDHGHEQPVRVMLLLPMGG